MTAHHRSAISRLGLAGALLLGLASVQATAADLDYRSVPNDRYSSAYEDPRYADLYAPAPARPPVVQHHAYGYAPIPHEPVYKYDDRRPDDRRYDERFEGPARPRGYGYQPYPPAAPRYAERQGCVSPRAAQRALEQDGWRDFSDLDLRADTATIGARRPDGRPFQLQLDRCTGELVSARPLQGQPYGPNVYGGRDIPRSY
jgi:hypothetical protein